MVQLIYLSQPLRCLKNILFDNYLIGNNNDEFVKKLRSLNEDKKTYEKYSLKSRNISIFYSKENVLNI